MMQKSDFSIERATKEDAGKLSKIEEESFSVPWSEDALSDTISRKDSVFFKAEVRGTVCGYIGAYFALDEWYITNVAVLRDYRRRGIAKELISALLREADKRDASFLTLEVRTGNIAAISLYEKLGFERVGMRPRFYTEPVEDAVLMTFFLRKDRMK